MLVVVHTDSDRGPAIVVPGLSLVRELLATPLMGVDGLVTEGIGVYQRKRGIERL